jgi:hypothetical protein
MIRIEKAISKARQSQAPNIAPYQSDEGSEIDENDV